MAFPATMVIDVRKSALDANSGGFDTAGTGTDYSQQTAAQVAYTDIIIDATTNTNCTSILTPFTAAHVGNTINITAGVGFTVQTVVINSVAAGVATCDKSLGTLGSVGGTGNLGGAKLTLGGAGALPLVSGNAVYIKYNATAFSSTSATSNIANGRFASPASVGTVASPLVIAGYESAHGDIPTTRPTLQWGVNAGTAGLITISSTGTNTVNVRNLILDCNQANFTQTKGLNNSSIGMCFCQNVKVTNASSNAVLMGGAGNLILVDCEITGCVTSTAISNTAIANLYFNGCYIHDNTVDAVTNVTTGKVFLHNNILDTNVSGGAKSHVVNSSTGMILAWNNTFYNAGTHGVDLQADCTALFVDNLFESNGGYGVNCAAAGVADMVMTYGNGYYSNTSGKYDTTKILTTQVFNEVNNTTGTFFTNAAGGDFSLNNNTNQGAMARAVSFPAAFAGSATNNYADIGAAQHQDTPASSGGPPRILVATGQSYGL